MLMNLPSALSLFMLVLITMSPTTTTITALPTSSSSETSPSSSNPLEHPNLHKRCAGKYDSCTDSDCCSPWKCQDYYGDGNWICWN